MATPKKIYRDHDYQQNKILNPVIENATFSTPPAGAKGSKGKEFSMVNGQSTYTLLELPNGVDVERAEVNGLGVDFTRVGVNLTIDEYSSSTIETGWKLIFYYFI